jgi:hypothetical protein
MNRRAITVTLVIAMAVLSGVARADSAWVYTAEESAPVRFAMTDTEDALRQRHFRIEPVADPLANGPPRVKVSVRFWPKRDQHWPAAFLAGFYGAKQLDVPEKIPAEGFSLRRLDGADSVQFHVFSADAAGAMYGGLELAEQIRLKGIDGVTDTDRAPYMPLRGTKFNIPLDLRTPSYSDMSDSAQKNIDTVWDFDFWRAYLDQLARDRYNMVSLWNLHPFPSMVEVPGYRDVALDDVWRSTLDFDADYPTRATDIVTPAMLAKHVVVRRLTIAQKIAFWRRVMQYAKDRNIEVYVFTWNIYTYGIDGKYGITDAPDNPKTIDYFRASVREMFHTYPLLAGMGLTVGENMGGADAFKKKEDWVFATYGRGVLDAARAEPRRRIRLIHRQHESRAQDIAATFAPLIAQPNVDFDFSFKYAQAHALSSTTQTFHRGYLEQLGTTKTFWTIRNDDALLLRWAAPDFVREFLTNIPREPTQGFYLGSDMWVWGRTFLGSGAPRLEIDKHWLHFLLWGRLGYDPTLDDERVATLVAARYPGIDGRRLLAAWQDASMVYPLVTGFHWADFDFQWYIEACRSRPAPAKTASGFHSVDTFIDQPVHPGTDNIPIPKYVAATLRGEGESNGTTPLAVADRIDARADAAIEALPSLVLPGKSGAALEFGATMRDAEKIRGATELALYRAGAGPDHKTLAITHLEKAAGFANRYAQSMIADYGARVWTNRVGIVDFAEMSADAGKDVDIARTAAATR